MREGKQFLAQDVASILLRNRESKPMHLRPANPSLRKKYRMNNQLSCTISPDNLPFDFKPLFQDDNTERVNKRDLPQSSYQLYKMKQKLNKEKLNTPRNPARCEFYSTVRHLDTAGTRNKRNRSKTNQTLPVRSIKSEIHYRKTALPRKINASKCMINMEEGKTNTVEGKMNMQQKLIGGWPKTLKQFKVHKKNNASYRPWSPRQEEDDKFMTVCLLE